VSATAVSALSTCYAGGTGNPTTCTDVDGDGWVNRVDNCPLTPNPDLKNANGDSRGDACEGDGQDPTLPPRNNPAATVRGLGDGYKNGAIPGMVTSGSYQDFEDMCTATFTAGSSVPVTPAPVCLAFRRTDAPPGPGLVWQDSNDNGLPDFLNVSGKIVRDHKGDANFDGYSDADEGTPAGCGGAGCGVFITKGTSETRTCQDPDRICGSGAQADHTWDPLRLPRNGPTALGTGCLTTLDEASALKTINLARSDVDLDGAVSILDLSKVASWFGNPVSPEGNDPRWEGNLDGDGGISILDLAAMAANFGRSVLANCKIE
jgi:hypothetical protein